jgi:hypothetical protein
LKAQKLLDRHHQVPLHKYKEISFFGGNKHPIDVKRYLLALFLLYGSTTFAQPTLVIGFLGGFVPAGEPHHPETKFVADMDREHPEIDYALFENHDVDGAYRMVLTLKPDRIILFGHSWGGSAVVTLARRLDAEGIPVVLTIQIDSVRKFWRDDSRIPANVMHAVNYYQTHGLVHGCKRIVAVNPLVTQVENIEWKTTPQKGISLRRRMLSRGHAEIEFDPAIWSQVRERILQSIPAKSGK